MPIREYVEEAHLAARRRGIVVPDAKLQLGLFDGSGDVWPTILVPVDGPGPTGVPRTVAATEKVERARLIRGHGKPLAQINNVPIAIAGIDDPITKYADLSRFDALKKYRGFKLALIHSYIDYPEVQTENADLILAGHTHGGQVLIMSENLMLQWVSSAYKKKFKYLAGFHQEGNTWVNVSRGLGLSALPIRFRSRPEISVIDLVK